MTIGRLLWGALVICAACLCGAGWSGADDGPSPKPRLDLTQAEQAWLDEHHTIRVGGPKAFPPFHYYEGDGPAQGISADYIALLARHLGLKLEYEHALPWPEVLSRVKRHELDVIACTAISPEREAYLNFSAPYLAFPLVIVTRLDAPFVGGLEDLNGKRVALVKGVPTGQWLQRDGIAVKPLEVGQPRQGLEAVSLGRADAYIGNLAAVAYMIQKHGLQNLKIAAPTSWGDYKLYFAVRKDWPLLASILTKALRSVDPAQLAAIRNKWISVRFEHGISTGEVLGWTALGLSGAGLIFLLLFLHNRALRREILERKAAEAQRREVIHRLETALSDIKQLSGLLPICASCKKIRDDKGYWTQVEQYIQDHSDAEFSHSICPDCMKELYPELPSQGRSKPNVHPS